MAFKDWIGRGSSGKVSKRTADGKVVPPPLVQAILDQHEERLIPVVPLHGANLLLRWMQQSSADAAAADKKHLAKAYYGWFTRDEIDAWWRCFCDEAGVLPCDDNSLAAALRTLPGVRYLPRQRIKDPEFAALRTRMLNQKDAKELERVSIYYIPPPGQGLIIRTPDVLRDGRVPTGVANGTQSAPVRRPVNAGTARSRRQSDLFQPGETAPAPERRKAA